jgi:hypothetical protein
VKQWKFFDENPDFQWYCKFCRDAVKESKNIVSQISSNSRSVKKKNYRPKIALQKIFEWVQQEEPESFRKMVEQQIFEKISESPDDNNSLRRTR